VDEDVPDCAVIEKDGFELGEDGTYVEKYTKEFKWIECDFELE